jgi:acyl carrier protein
MTQAEDPAATGPRAALPVPADGAALKLEIKRVIIAAVESDLTPEAIDDDAVLVGEDSVLLLDSLDALQAAVAVSKRFGVRVRDGKHARRVMRSVNSLAEFIGQHR